MDRIKVNDEIKEAVADLYGLKTDDFVFSKDFAECVIGITVQGEGMKMFFVEKPVQWFLWQLDEDENPIGDTIEFGIDRERIKKLARFFNELLEAEDADPLEEYDEEDEGDEYED